MKQHQKWSEAKDKWWTEMKQHQSWIEAKDKKIVYKNEEGKHKNEATPEMKWSHR